MYSNDPDKWGGGSNPIPYVAPSLAVNQSISIKTCLESGSHDGAKT